MKTQHSELLKFNYRNLHESVWEAHKAAWTVTGIFVPAILALQGYLAAKYDTVDDRTEILLVAGVILSELVAIVWRLIMCTLEHYNDVRMRRLKEIEGLFAMEIGSDVSFKLVQQYNLGYRPKIAGTRIDINPPRIYNLILVIITTMNICIVHRQLGCWIFPIVLAIWIIALATVLIRGWWRKRLKRRRDVLVRDIFDS